MQLEKAKSGEAAHKDTVDALRKELDARSESLSSTSNDVEQLNRKISELKNLLENEKENAEQVSSIHFIPHGRFIEQRITKDLLSSTSLSLFFCFYKVLESRVKDFTKQLESQSNNVESLEETIKTNREEIKDTEEKYTQAKVHILCQIYLLHAHHLLLFEALLSSLHVGFLHL